MGSGERITPPGSPAHLTAARNLIDSHESHISAADRRERGAHYTPHALADLLSAVALDAVAAEQGRLPGSICDMSCGAGAFLVATAEQMALRGADPVDLVERRLTGFDVDPSAVLVARTALREWAETRSGRRAEQLRPRIEVRDVLAPDSGGPVGTFDLVVGNPPFLTQLKASSALGRDRFRSLAGRLGGLDPYVDTSGLFLLLALEATNPGGVACMIQPQSFLSARGAGGVRDAVLMQCSDITLWSSPHQLFDASVRVCAVVATRRTPHTSPARTEVSVAWSAGRDSLAPTDTYLAPRPVAGNNWGPLLAAANGIPVVAPVAPGGVTVGDVATATAGFRDEYYALRDACLEGDIEGSDGSRPGLMTVGMIGPCRTDRGAVPARIGGRRWTTPVVDMEHLAEHSPRVHRWASARLVPKVLVATQTRIVEAVADVSGAMIPMTPVISVEPHRESVSHRSGEPEVDLWWLVAALSAPDVSARMVAENLGSGLSAQSLRCSARDVQMVPLPVDHAAWAVGATAARRLASLAVPAATPAPDSLAERERLMGQLGAAMLRANCIDDGGEVLEWWLERALSA